MPLTQQHLNRVSFRPGQKRLRAKDLQTLTDSSKAAMNPSFSGKGQHVIIDKDGIHVRQVPQTIEVVERRAFWGIVTASFPNDGYVMVRRGKGSLGGLYAVDTTAPPIKVWVGLHTFLRGPAGNYYDEVYCMPDDTDSTYPYIGFANIPGFGYEEPTTGFSVDQDNPPMISGEV